MVSSLISDKLWIIINLDRENKQPSNLFLNKIRNICFFMIYLYDDGILSLDFISRHNPF